MQQLHIVLKRCAKVDATEKLEVTLKTKKEPQHKKIHDRVKIRSNLNILSGNWVQGYVDKTDCV